VHQFFPQESFIPCRTFSVGANGTIVQGPPAEVDGEPCHHVRGVDAATGGVTISFMPFERNMNACGAYVAYIIPSGSIAHPTTAVAALFFSAPNPPPATFCGDGNVDAGEACDDGNTVDHDGCSSTCEVECDPVH
jgi:cysteine-rich repeat protein